MRKLLLSLIILTSCSEKEEERVSGQEEEVAIQETLPLHPAAKDQTYDRSVHDIVVREDPRRDGWDSEVFAEAAMKELKVLGKSLLKGPIDQSIFHPDFSSGGTIPEEFDEVFRSDELSVSRGHGSAGLLEPFFKEASDTWIKFKIIDVALLENSARTEVLVQAAGNGANDESLQVNARWSCLWSDQSPPLLQEIRIHDHESIIAKTGFTDCTAQALTDQKLIDSQLVHGRDHWHLQLESALGVEGRGNGIAIGDINNDGLEDLYLCQPAALPNRLMLRQPDGSLRDISARAGLDWLDSTRAALFVDLDNDGDQDLALTIGTRVIIHENAGDGTFPVRAAFASKSLLFSLNAIDYDGDGALDLFACGYSGAGQISPQDIFASPMPYHDANNGAPSALLKNEGAWKFQDVTAETGLGVNNLRFSLASAWEDYDNDGDPDLYVANDFGRNNLYRNEGGRFTDVAAQAGVEDIGPGMSVAWGDVNNDGFMDLYVSNMFSSAGSRITRQEQFQPGMTQEDLKGFQRHARGNSLFINQGDGTFQDKAEESGTVMGRWAWGSQFVDLNNDGWKDLYVTNGFVTAGKPDDDL